MGPLTCIGVNEPIDCAAVSARDTISQVLNEGSRWVADVVNTEGEQMSGVLNLNENK